MVWSVFSLGRSGSVPQAPALANTTASATQAASFGAAGARTAGLPPPPPPQRGRVRGRWAVMHRGRGARGGVRAVLVTALLAGLVVVSPGVPAGTAQAQGAAAEEPAGMPGVDLVLRGQVVNNDNTYLGNPSSVEVFTEGDRTLAVIVGEDDGPHLVDLSDPADIDPLPHANTKAKSGNNNFNNSGGLDRAIPFVGADGKRYVLAVWINSNAVQTFRIAADGRLDEVAALQDHERLNNARDAFIYSVDGKQYAAVLSQGGQKIGPQGLKITGSAGNSLNIVDVSDPTSLSGKFTDEVKFGDRLNSTPVADAEPRGIAHYYDPVEGKHYAVVVTAGVANSVLMFDVTDPENIVGHDIEGTDGNARVVHDLGVLQRLGDPTMCELGLPAAKVAPQVVEVPQGCLLSGAHDVEVYTVGTRAYAVVAAKDDDAIQIIDVSVPTSLRAAGNLSGFEAVESVALHTIGGRHYAAVPHSNGLSIVDVSDPMNPVLLKTITETEGVSGRAYTEADMFSIGNRHYVVATRQTLNRAQTFEIIPRWDATASGDGSLDASFGRDGVVVFDDDAHEDAFAVAVQADGKIVSAGYRRVAAGTRQVSGETVAVYDTDVLLTRHNVDGSLDTTFGDGGKVVTDFNPSGRGIAPNFVPNDDDRAYDLLIQPDQKIVIAGSTYNDGIFAGTSHGQDILVARYNPDGSLDTSFGDGGGKSITPSATGFGKASAADAAYSLALRPDGKLVVAGNSGSDSMVARLFSNGQLDILDGNNPSRTPNAENCGGPPTGGPRNEDPNLFIGARAYDIVDGQELFSSVVLQPDGKMLIAGASNVEFVFPDGRPANLFPTFSSAVMLRLNPDCTIDRSFNGSGQVIDALDPSFDGPGVVIETRQSAGISRQRQLDEVSEPFYTAMQVQPDGKIVAALRNSPGVQRSSVGLVRYNSDGSRDTSFGDAQNGLVNTRGLNVETLALLPNGNIIAAGYINNQFGLQRYNSDGTIDTSFGLLGTASAEMLTDEKISKIRDIAVAPDGSIIAAGYTGTYTAEGNRDVAIARFANTLYPLTVWEETLTVQDLGGGDFGCRNSEADAVDKCSTTATLSDASFTYEDIDYSVRSFAYTSGSLAISLDKDIPAAFRNLVLAVDNIEFPLTSADFVLRGIFVPMSIQRTLAALRPPAGGKVNLRLYYDGDWAGDLDQTFGNRGLVAPSVPGAAAEANAVAVQSDGKTVLAGYAHNGTDRDFALVRLNVDGSLDTGFGDEGRVVTAIGSGNDEARAVAIDSEERIVVAGNAFVANRDFAVARYLPSGELDATFSDDGMATTNFGANDDVYAVLVDSEDNIVVAGQAGLDFGVLRYTEAGELDATFSTDGMHTEDVGGTDGARAAAFVGEKILLGGFATNNNGTPAVTTDDHTDMALLQLTAGGAPDTDFSTDGMHTVNLSATARPNDGINSLTIQGDNKIIAVGYTGVGNKTLAIARFTAAGALDTTFGGDLNSDSTPDGFTTSALRGEFHAAFVNSNGSIVAVGASAGATVLARYTAAGAADTTFGSSSNILVTTSLAGFAQAAALRHSGGIVTGGYVTNSANREFVAAAFNLDGSADTTFGVAGVTATRFGAGNTRIEANAVALQDDGKAVLAGYANSLTGRDFALMRLNSDGSLDTTFGDGGWVTTPIGTSTSEARAVAVDSDDRIVVAGTATGTNRDFAVARYLPTGALDASFAGGGTATHNFGSNDDAYAVLVDSSKKVVVVGQAGNNFGVVRYTEAGELDTTFGADGADADTDPDGFLAVAVAGVSGARAAAFVGTKLVLGGFATNDNGTTSDTSDDHTDMALVQLVAADGELDTTFSSDGKHTENLHPTTATPDDGINSLAIITAMDSNSNPITRILAAGYHGLAGKQPALALFTPAGALDTTFGGDIDDDSTKDGYTNLDSSGEYRAAFVTNWGEIVAVGASPGGTLIARYANVDRMNAGESEDPVAGAPASIASLPGSARAAVLNPNKDRYFVAGSVTNPERKFFAAKFKQDATLDTGFGASGVTTAGFGSDNFEIAATAALPDGKVVAVGTVTTGTGASAASSISLMLFNADGSPNLDFGNQSTPGRTDFKIGESSEAHAVAYNSATDRIIVAGSSKETLSSDFDFLVTSVAAGVNTVSSIGPGVLDSVFATDGTILVDVGSGTEDVARAIAIDSNNDIVVVGETTAAGGNSDFAVVRIAVASNGGGSLDTGFDTDGKATVDFNSGADVATSVVVTTSSDAITVGGVSTLNNKDRFALARLTSTGALDATYGTGGRVVTDSIAAQSRINDLAAFGSDGSVIAAGASGASADSTHFTIAKYGPAGALDSDFGDSGAVVARFGTMPSAIQALAVVGDPDGPEDVRIAVAGHAGPSGARLAALARFNDDGSLDNTFGNHGFSLNGDPGQWTRRNTANYAPNRWRNAGRVTTQLPGPQQQFNSIAVAEDNTIIAGGFAGNSGDRTPALARYIGTGSVSNDATLEALTVLSAAAGSETFDGQARFAPTFDPETLTYEVVLKAGAANLKITPTIGNDQATMTIQNDDEAAQPIATGTASDAVEIVSEKQLSPSGFDVLPISNTTTIEVTAQDQQTVLTYNLTYRYETTNPYALVWIQTSSDGSTFTDVPSGAIPASRRTRCSQQLGRFICRFNVFDEDNPVTHVKFVPTAEQDNILLTINDVAVPSGTASAPFAFTFSGARAEPITTSLRVEAENGATRDYALEAINVKPVVRTGDNTPPPGPINTPPPGGGVGGGGGGGGGGADNLAPRFAQTPPVSLSVAENSPPGTPVGDPVTATDPDNDTIRYALTGSDLFDIDPATGQITVADDADLDHETDPNSFSLTVQATDPDGSNTSTDVQVNINVTDITLPSAISAYDTDNDERICFSEILVAIDAYTTGALNARILNALIRAYLTC